MKLTILFFTLAVVVSANENTVKEKFRCTEGVNYKENECNTCQCLQGDLACSRMMCVTNDKSLRNCEVGTAWNKGCKRCWCVENMGTVCTTNCYE